MHPRMSAHTSTLQCTASCFLPTPVNSSSYSVAHKDLKGSCNMRPASCNPSSHVGKDLENLQRGMAELSPCLFLTGQMWSSLLEDPQQHHRQAHHHFNHGNCPRKHFHLSHPSPLFPLCRYKSYSAQRSECGK